MAFNIDMSPLERSTSAVTNNLGKIGQSVGDTIYQNRQANAQQEQQAQLQGLVQAAVQGKDGAIDALYAVDPATAKQLEERSYAQQDRITEQEQREIDNRFKTPMAIATADVVEQIAFAKTPEEAQEIFDASVDDDRFDIDEEDRTLFMIPEKQKAVIAKVKGEDYADRLFKGPIEQAKFQQGTGDMAGYSFNPNDGTFSIDPNTKAKIEEIKLKPELDAKDRLAINKEFTSLTKDTKLIRNTAADLEKLANIKNGPASIAMVFKFMKALDPTSVVREGEFATAENSAGVPENVRNMYNKVMEGGRLGDAQIEQFVLTAKELANSAIDSSNQEVGSFLNTFEGSLPKNFKDSIQKRVPERFEVKSKAVDWSEL